MLMGVREKNCSGGRFFSHHGAYDCIINTNVPVLMSTFSNECFNVGDVNCHPHDAYLNPRNT